MKNFKNKNFIVFVFLCLTKVAFSQIVISKPTLGFTQACASASFNTYEVSFTFSPEANLTGSNQFMVELSDGTGDFSNAEIIYTSNAGAVTTSPATLTFSLPIETAGEGYRIKIKSTSPVASSTASDAFAAYYKPQDSPFTINNLISTGVFCSGGSYLLTIDNPGNGNNDSPLQYPSLTYKWYKETSQTTSVFVAFGETLAVSEAGTYFVETDYGSCTSNSFSNRVTVSEATSETTTEINSSLGNPYCSTQGDTTLSAINGVDYQWYKDGEQISGATEQMYVTNEPGNYTVDINLGDCRTTASIDLENNGFNSSIDVLDINSIEENETIVATVTTDAMNPEFKWYLNENLITGANTNSFEITETGNYRVEVRQTMGCIATNEFNFIVRTPFPDVANIPNLISPNGDGINDTWEIPQAYVSGTETQVVIMSSQGKVELQTNDYQNNWPTNQIDFKDINPVYYYIITTPNGDTKKGSITVVK